ncbi:4-coumarate--CoA ligase 1-like isoform X2 [Venturia canescens]|uniref:4-coumarate--CoA ligase 1-like isoform X2 n=1 Tax=Venturia canescens TaxID=32260 RepID=UPI001C9CF161|nr:4-coumarate--CoA ligase 1-like isoform X2 [Venturia canescens]
MTTQGANDFELKNGILHGFSEPFLPKYQNYGEVILDSMKSNPDFVGQNFLELGRLDESVRSINFSSISWGVGIACFFRSLVAPETRIVYPHFDPEETLRLIDKFEINLMHLSPRKAFKLQKTCAASNYDVSSVKLFWISGGVLKSEMQTAIAASFPRAKVFQAYGSSELGGVAFRQSPGFEPNSCGTIVRNVEMKVVDIKSGRILGARETGEALFKSPFMMTSYLGNPEATKKAIDSEGWLHSGDLVHYEEKGHVFVTDRVSEMINYRGHFISPESIEQAMYIHPAISDVAVVSIPHDEDGERPIAFVSETPGTEVTEIEVENMMAESLPDGEKIRGCVRFLDKIPRLLSGKIARAELRKLAMSYER